MHLRIESPMGNRLLAVVGAVAAAGSALLLILLVRDVWHAASMIDRLLQLALAVSVLIGAWMFVNALSSLRHGGSLRPATPRAPMRRDAAAARR